MPTTKRAEVLAAFQTNGANCEVYTQDIIRWLDELEMSQPFLLTGAGFDWCAGTFTKPLVDSKKLAKKMYKFCPDIVDQGTGDVSRLALDLKRPSDSFFGGISSLKAESSKEPSAECLIQLERVKGIEPS